MAKIPFTLEAWLKDKSQKVIDNNGNELVICSFEFTPNEPYIHAYEKKNGCGRKGYKLDEVFFCPESEMTEFEKAVGEAFYAGCDIEGMLESNPVKQNIKEIASKLLDLARKEFVKQGYVIEKKVFHDAVEKINDIHKTEMRVEYSLHCEIENGTHHAVMNWEEFQKVAQHFINFGKEEALKDLPRWRRWGNGVGGRPRTPFAIVKRGLNGYELVNMLGSPGEQYIMLSDLEKLPGFKEI